MRGMQAQLSIVRELSVSFPLHLTSIQYATLMSMACSMAPINVLIQNTSYSHMPSSRSCGQPFFQLEACLYSQHHLTAFTSTIPFSFSSCVFRSSLHFISFSSSSYSLSKDRLLSCPPDYYLHEMKCDGISLAQQGCLVPEVLQR